MSDLDAAARYLQNLLPDMVDELEPWPSSRPLPLPHFLASLFGLAEIDLLGNRVLLANVLAQAEPMPPSRLIAQVHRLAEKSGLRGVLVLSGVSPYIRSRLIESRVDFVVPGSQLFAPSFLMSLRERDTSPPVSLPIGEQLSYPAQAVRRRARVRRVVRRIPGPVRDHWRRCASRRDAGREAASAGHQGSGCGAARGGADARVRTADRCA